MIARKTVLILGAGGSAPPYGFPTARGVLDEVLDMFNPGSKAVHISQALLNHGGFSGEFVQEFRNALNNSRLHSVDRFLERRADKYLDIGKMAIAACLIAYENAASLDRTNKPGWYDLLVDALLTEEPEDFAKNKLLSIVTFNYDRSLEYALIRAIEANYGLIRMLAKPLYQHIPIVHLYGQLGLPHFVDEGGLKYTGRYGQQSLKIAADGIDIVRTNDPEPPQFKKAHELIKEAQTLCFFGFGFDDTNFNRLKVDEHFSGDKIFATGRGLRPAKYNDVFKTLRSMHEEAVVERDTILDLMGAHNVFAD